MFSNEDFKNYFQEIKDIEEYMVKIDEELIKENPPTKVLKILEHIKKDEIKHKKMATEILKML